MPKAERAGTGTAAIRSFQQSRRSTLLAGLVLILLGALALLLPQQATIAASTGLGGLLVIAGAVTIVQAVRTKGIGGFNWALLAGAAEVVGGVLIWLSPMKGAAAIALLVVIVVAVQGATHLLMSMRFSETRGRIGLALSGIVSIAIALILVSRFPYQSVTEPGAMAGLALIVAGFAHFILATARRGAKAGPAK